MLTFPQIMDSNKPNDNDKRFPMSGSIDQIGSDLKKIKGEKLLKDLSL
jgi:hypothetical protein